MARADPSGGLWVEPAPGGLRIHNPGPAPVVALRIGEARLARLGPGEAATVPTAAEGPVAARFDPTDWGRALTDLSPGWADTHLRTAGHFLDTVDAGPAGDPSRSINLRLLATVEPTAVADWLSGPPLRRALVARAARHLPPSALDPLLSAVAPETMHGPWPPAYAALSPLADGVRRAIELHGAAALPAVRRHPRWALDRGIGAQFETPSSPDDAAARLAEALSAGDFSRAASLAAGLVADRGPAPRAPAVARQICGALDTAAQQDLRHGRWLAAEGWLRLAGRACGPSGGTRRRAAALFRARGDARRAQGDLVGAVGFYRAGFWLAGAPPDRARLADAHGELALLRYRAGAVEAGDRQLAAARALDSLRPRVQAAIEARPTVDLRARIAVALIILVMGVFVIRRLGRVLRGDRIPGSRAALKAPRGPW